MKCKFLPVFLLLTTASVFSVDSSNSVHPVGTAVQNFFERFSVKQVYSDLKVDVRTTKSEAQQMIKNYIASDSGVIDTKLGQLKHLQAKDFPLASGALHKTVEGRFYIPGQDLFSVDNLNEDTGTGKTAFEAGKEKYQALKVWVNGVVTSQPAEQEKVKEKSLLTQISENPGTTAALTAGTVVALYGSYKLIQYFDRKKAKKIALARRLEAQRKQLSVVFE
jgi:hypothetical protein